MYPEDCHGWVWWYYLRVSGQHRVASEMANGVTGISYLALLIGPATHNGSIAEVRVAVMKKRRYSSSHVESFAVFHFALMIVANQETQYTLSKPVTRKNTQIPLHFSSNIRSQSVTSCTLISMELLPRCDFRKPLCSQEPRYSLGR
jgi:hypothetical protein